MKENGRKHVVYLDIYEKKQKFKIFKFFLFISPLRYKSHLLNTIIDCTVLKNLYLDHSFHYKTSPEKFEILMGTQSSFFIYALTAAL